MKATSSSTSPSPSRSNRWMRHVGAMLATTLIFVSSASFLSLLEAFH